MKLSIVWLQILCFWNLPQLLFQRKTVSKSSMLVLHSVDLISYLITLLSSFFNSACSFLHRGTRAPPEHGKIFIPRKSLLEWVSLMNLYITVVLMLKLLLLQSTFKMRLKHFSFCVWGDNKVTCIIFIIFTSFFSYPSWLELAIWLAIVCLEFQSEMTAAYIHRFSLFSLKLACCLDVCITLKWFLVVDG